MTMPSSSALTASVTRICCALDGLVSPVLGLLAAALAAVAGESAAAAAEVAMMLFGDMVVASALCYVYALGTKGGGPLVGTSTSCVGFCLALAVFGLVGLSVVHSDVSI